LEVAKSQGKPPNATGRLPIVLILLLLLLIVAMPAVVACRQRPPCRRRLGRSRLLFLPRSLGCCIVLPALECRQFSERQVADVAALCMLGGCAA